MRRLLIIATATALFLSVAVGIAGALDSDAWFGSARGHMVVTDPDYDGLKIRLAVETAPIELNWTRAEGRASYAYDGDAFRLDVTHACVHPEKNTIAVWGPASVKSGSFDDGALVKGDEGYAVLSLLDEGKGVISARAGIFAGPNDPAFTMIAQQCEWPATGSAFPATGHGNLKFKADVVE